MSDCVRTEFEVLQILRRLEITPGNPQEIVLALLSSMRGQIHITVAGVQSAIRKVAETERY